MKIKRGGGSKLNKKISLKSQIKRIAETFPNAEFKNKDGNSFQVLIKLQPTPLSKFYEIKIDYSIIKGIEIYVINEKLQIAERRNSLPHVYSTEKQKLCLFTYANNDWNDTMSISSTIIPWTSEWLYFYEIWLINGDWLGGGHDEYINDNNTKSENE